MTGEGNPCRRRPEADGQKLLTSWDFASAAMDNLTICNPAPGAGGSLPQSVITITPSNPITPFQSATVPITPPTQPITPPIRPITPPTQPAPIRPVTPPTQPITAPIRPITPIEIDDEPKKTKAADQKLYANATGTSPPDPNASADSETPAAAETGPEPELLLTVNNVETVFPTLEKM